MCVMSIVSDFYKDKFPPTPIVPFMPTIPPSLQTTITYQPDLTELNKLIQEFKEAMAAAKKVDKLTGQPNCEDMGAKGELEKRVASLEEEIKELKKRGK